MFHLMTMPLRADLPWYKFRITLTGIIYEVDCRYNPRMQRWIMNLNDPSGNPILTGIPVLIQRNLTGQYQTLAIPAGILFATDNTGQGNQPTQFSFGSDHTLFYADPGVS